MPRLKESIIVKEEIYADEAHFMIHALDFFSQTIHTTFFIKNIQYNHLTASLQGRCRIQNDRIIFDSLQLIHANFIKDLKGYIIFHKFSKKITGAVKGEKLFLELFTKKSDTHKKVTPSLPDQFLKDPRSSLKTLYHAPIHSFKESDAFDIHIKDVSHPFFSLDSIKAHLTIIKKNIDGSIFGNFKDGKIESLLRYKNKNTSTFTWNISKWPLVLKKNQTIFLDSTLFGKGNLEIDPHNTIHSIRGHYYLKGGAFYVNNIINILALSKKKSAMGSFHFLQKLIPHPIAITKKIDVNHFKTSKEHWIEAGPFKKDSFDSFVKVWIESNFSHIEKATLNLSYYLNQTQKIHGIIEFQKDFSNPSLKIDNPFKIRKFSKSMDSFLKKFF
jgi:hypothetical protein